MFIATQGPKRNTVIDFWNMVLEQKSNIIVCLTNTMEIGNVIHAFRLNLYIQVSSN